MLLPSQLTWFSLCSQVPADLGSFVSRLASLRPSLEALRPQLESIGNVLPWAQQRLDDAVAASEVAAAD